MSLGTWNPAFYLLIVPLVALDAAVPAVPSEVFVVTTGALGAGGHLHVAIAILVAAIGAWLGDTMVYYLFKRKLSRFLDRFRWGRWLHRATLKACHKGGNSSTYAAIIAGRFIPAGRTATMAAAGMAHVPTRGFLLASAVGSLMWACWLVGLGFLTGAATDLPWWGSALIGVGVGLAVGAVIAALISMRSAWLRRYAPHEAEPAPEARTPAASTTAP
ncbi:DedA family protein [Arthrobacter castelli]|uniref:DedA family protein n=1 Tax=Arthrobacter castelli TaxID=271431 RepID=UPI000409964B|nr:VTT domain-containing protein [Arthrobacter castelli]